MGRPNLGLTKPNAHYVREYYKRHKANIIVRKVLKRATSGCVPRLATVKTYQVPMTEVAHNLFCWAWPYADTYAPAVKMRRKLKKLEDSLANGVPVGVEA